MRLFQVSRPGEAAHVRDWSDAGGMPKWLEQMISEDKRTVSMAEHRANRE